ncbi:hypothetical protein [Streptomyces sp. NPDC001401]|uniref:hypothetical protein n=1 Tax=Streptomyces sp. NPDC001401 TaxID=3364570 RepID=UPI0036A9310B
MITRFTTKARWRLVALAVTVGLALGTAGCAGGDAHQNDTPGVASKNGGSFPHAQLGQSVRPLAEIKGRNSLTLTITSAERDDSGFLTVRGELKNGGAATAVIPAELRGNELAIVRNGQSLGGATLVDYKGRKRYYVLRDTQGRPLTTTGLSSLKARESVPVFLQFSAPPTSTTEVGFQLPLFDTATIKISG